MKKWSNKSTIIRSKYDKEHPFTVISNCWNDYRVLNGTERAIMLEIMSNSDSFVINKLVVKKRLDFYDTAFNNAWKSLEDKGFIFSEKIGLGYEYAVRESNTLSLEDKPLEDNPREDSPREDSPREDSPLEDYPQENNPYSSSIASDKPLEDYPPEDYPPEATKQIKNRINTKSNKPKTQVLSPKGEIQSRFLKTDKFISAEAEITLSVPGVPPVDCTLDDISRKNKEVLLKPKVEFEFGSSDLSEGSLFDLGDFINEDNAVLDSNKIVIHKGQKDFNRNLNTKQLLQKCY
jgi:hypothetical protein